jgi:iron(III) transport system substrate-binding protein
MYIVRTAVIHGVEWACGSQKTEEPIFFPQMTSQRDEIMRRFSLSSLFLIVLPILSWLCFVEPIKAQDSLAGAQIEKKLVLYHSPNVPDTQRILAGFRQKYPFIELETYRASGEKLIQRITTETRAGKNISDAYLLSGFQTWLLKAMGLLSLYASPEREKIPAALKDADGYWTGVYWNLEVLAYNTKMVRSSQVPKAWEDLLAPHWKSQFALEEEDVDWYTAMLQLMGEAKGKDFMRRLAAQQPQIRTGHTLLAQLIGAGEFALAPTIRVHQAETMKLKGAPIEWTAIEPLAPNPPISISISKNTSHPQVAKLFTDFVLSREGQMIIYQLNRNPSRTDVPQPVPRAAKIRLMTMDYDQVVKNYARYASEFRETFSVRQ